MAEKIVIVAEKTDTGFSAYAKDYGIATTGDDLKEIKENILDAVNLYFEDEGKVITENDLYIILDLPQFFEYYKVINVSALSDRIGINRSLLMQYISGKKSPSPVQTNKILEGVKSLGRELASIDFRVRA